MNLHYYSIRHTKISLGNKAKGKHHTYKDFPDALVVGTSPSNVKGVASIPHWGADIQHVSGPKNQNVKQKQYCNIFNQDFKNDPHQKKSLKKIRGFSL